MSDKTKIEWSDATWNPITGCSVVSPGCTNCYAMRLAGTRLKHLPSRAGLTRETKVGPVWTGEVRFNETWLDQPLRWSSPRKIFVCAHGDLFAEGVPDAWIDRVFAVMALAPQHVFQVLTKRPDRMRGYLHELTRRERWKARLAGDRDLRRDGVFPVWPLRNVWVGVSVEDQRRADERIPVLLDTPAAVRWISAEPLLAAVRLRERLGNDWLASGLSGERKGLDWVIVGGESGPGARPMHPDWARSLRDQCAAAGVAFLFKQWGSHRLGTMALGSDVICWQDGAHEFNGEHQDIKYGLHWLSNDEHGLTIAYPVGKTAAGRMLDGVTHDGYPEPRL